jgi:CheY-like chemotaxis protein
MFIDDDVNRITSHIEALELAGYEVDTKTSVVAALTALEAKADDYSLLILDMQMPRGPYTREASKHGRITGLELLRQIRSLYGRIPVLVLSVIRNSDVIETVKTLGVLDYCQKPMAPSDLIAKIKEYEPGET